MRIDLNTADQNALELFAKSGGSLGLICDQSKCTQDHVHDRIMRICDTSSIASEIFSKLKDNDRFYRKDEKGRKAKTKHESKVPSKRDAQARKPQLPVPETHAEKLARLRTEEEYFSSDVAKAEAEVAKYQSEHIEKQQAIVEVQTELERHIKEIGELRKKFDELEAADKEAIDKRDTAGLVKDGIATKLEAIRAEIAQLDKVKIRVSSESIEVSNNEFTAEPDEKERIFGRIVKMKACEELRLKDIRRMAALFAILHKIDRKVELTFEDHEFETAYYALYSKGVI